jgi:hypothetical protein
MPDELGNFHEDALDELIHKMRRYSDDGDSRYRTLHAELDRRVPVSQIKAANAQIRSAWYQVTAVIAMFLTVIATLAAPLVGHLLCALAENVLY